MKILQTMAMTILLSSAFSLNAADELHDKFSDEELIQILKDDGYTSVKMLTDGLLVVKVNGKKFIINNENDGDLTAYSGFTEYNVSLANINQWNQNYRLSRAYLDEENDPVIESDLLTDAGINKEHVTNFFDVFLQSVSAFEGFITKHNDK